MNGLSADGGGDTPESIYTGIMTALGLDWRTGAHKEVIVIGDAGGHSPDPVTGYTEDDVVAKALALNPVVVNAIPASSAADATFGPVAVRTGGADNATAGDTVSAIEHTIQAAETAPVAALGGPYDGDANRPIQLSAAASYSPLGRALTFGWDFNNDGIVDQTTNSPTVAHTFPGGYTGVVTVSVSDTAGQKALAQAQVQAAGTAPLAPSSPGTPVLTPGDAKVAVAWTPGRGGGAPAVYELADGLGHPYAYIKPTAAKRQRANVPGVSNGLLIRLKVIAINGGGATAGRLSAAVVPLTRRPVTEALGARASAHLNSARALRRSEPTALRRLSGQPHRALQGSFQAART